MHDSTSSPEACGQYVSDASGYHHRETTRSLSRTFSFAVPGWCNDLSIPTRTAESQTIFKKQLKSLPGALRNTHTHTHTLVFLYFILACSILDDILYFVLLALLVSIPPYDKSLVIFLISKLLWIIIC